VEVIIAHTHVHMLREEGKWKESDANKK